MDTELSVLEGIGWMMIIVTIVSVILNILSTYCAWSSRQTSRTLIDYFIVFYNASLLQTATFAQVLTVVRIATWKNDDSVKPWICLGIYLSSTFGAIVVEVCLTVISILRYFFVFHTSYGVWIIQHEKGLRISLSFFVLGVAALRMASDFFLNPKSLYMICIDKETIGTDSLLEPSIILFYVYFLFTYGIDMSLMVKLWVKQFKRYRQVGLMNLNTMNTRRQQNLLTFSGNALCRLFMFLTYVLIYVQFGFMKSSASVSSSRQFFGVTYLLYFMIFTVIVPLVQFFTSPLMRLPIFSVYRKLTKAPSNDIIHMSTKRKEPFVISTSRD